MANNRFRPSRAGRSLMGNHDTSLVCLRICPGRSLDTVIFRVYPSHIQWGRSYSCPRSASMLSNLVGSLHRCRRPPPYACRVRTRCTWHWQVRTFGLVDSRGIRSCYYCLSNYSWDIPRTQLRLLCWKPFRACRASMRPDRGSLEKSLSRSPRTDWCDFSGWMRCPWHTSCR